MDGKFRPQETSMNSFRETEEKLFQHFSHRGYDSEVSKAIAYNFSQYVMGYITAEGAAHFIRQAGADIETARDVVAMFRAAKGESKSRRRMMGRKERSAALL